MPVKKTELEPLRPLAKGGYGVVYRVAGNPFPGDQTPLAYKEFTSDLGHQRRSAQAAVAFRDGLGPDDRDDLDRCAVWPRAVVLGADGEISGLLMQLIPDAFRCELLDSDTGKKGTKVRDRQWLGATRAQCDAAEIDLRPIELVERLILLGKLIYAVGRLHKHGWVFGDLSAGADFAVVLESVRASLKRDRGPRQAADATSRPAAVFFAPEPPLADSAAVELFCDLAREASIVWALPRSARALLSGAFAGVPGVRVVTDDPSVADEIAALLSSDTDAVKAVT